ncbi:MAG: hypothetical protein WAP51_01285 [Candidatus Sungiibacteriota bacterium]
MNTRRTPRELARDLSARAAGKYQMAAVLSDRRGIFAWGWNHSVRIIGANAVETVHAEEHAIKRANPRRLSGSTLTVYGEKNTGKLLFARPCKERCEVMAKKHGVAKIEYHASDGWRAEKLAYVAEAR